MVMKGKKTFSGYGLSVLTATSKDSCKHCYRFLCRSFTAPSSCALHKKTGARGTGGDRPGLEVSSGLAVQPSRAVRGPIRPVRAVRALSLVGAVLPPKVFSTSFTPLSITP